MPYIITTTQTLETDVFGATDTRTAVATLEEVRDSVVKITSDARGSLVAALGAISESGGIVDPLPDGTVIEVRPVDRFTLGWEAGLIAADHPQLWKDADLVKRFNAAS